MQLHDVRVHPSKSELAREDQLAWRIAAVAADGVAVEAEVAEIAQVPGIGPTTAAAIKDAVAQASGTRQTVSVTPAFNAATGEIIEES